MAVSSLAKIERARLVNTNTGDMLNLGFNPSSLAVAKSVTYTGNNNQESDAGGQEMFGSTGTKTLNFTMYLDEWESLTGADVHDDVAKLHRWCNPDDTLPGPRQPPNVMFVWGRFQFEGKLTSVSATFDMFRKDGSAARAEVQVAMSERPTPPAAQNPTSGGLAGRRSRTVFEGDTLAGIAYRELGSAALWRIVADMNGIDDPSAVAPGAVVLLPSSADAAAELRRLRADPARAGSN